MINDVFISYAYHDYMDEQGREIDGNIISRLMRTFDDAGISYWIDRQGLSVGDRFSEVIAEQIKNARVFLFVSTEQSNLSEWTHNEIALARQLGKRIIPFRVDDTPYDTSIMLYLAGLQYVNYGDNPEKALHDVVAVVRQDFSKEHLTYSRQPIRRWDTIKLWCQRHWIIISCFICLILAFSIGGAYYNAHKHNTYIHLDKDSVVYVTPKGLCYHIDPDCPHIKNRSKSSTTIVEAEQYGKRPCKTCCKKQN